MKSYKTSQIYGKLRAPGSKSDTIRALVGALFSGGITNIYHPSESDDALACVNILKSFNCKVIKEENRLIIDSSDIEIPDIINCEESGLLFRMFCAIASLFDKEIKITGKKQLLERNHDFIKKPLTGKGVEVISVPSGFIIKGPLQFGKFYTDGSISSQFLSGLLFTLPFLKSDSEIHVMDLKSRPYIDMTIQTLEKFGIKIIRDKYSYFKIKGSQKYKPADIYIEGDWSGAAFLLVAGAINGEIEVTGLNPSSLQPDVKILEVLSICGAKLKIESNRIFVKKLILDSFAYDISDCPDLFPPLVCLGLNCIGKSVIYGTDRLKYKESDRVKALYEELSPMGAEIEVSDNKVYVSKTTLKGRVLNPRNDHRIAMSGAILSLNSFGEIKILNKKCVSKSYPDFFNELAKVTIK